MDLLQKFSTQFCKPSVPRLKPGYQIKVHQKIVEGAKERIQIFEGVVIKIGSGFGVNKTFTVRKVTNGVGVEKVYFLHSPNTVNIEIARAHKVRRSKLYFLRELSGKALRLPEKPLNLTYDEFDIPKEEPEPIIEEVATESTADSISKPQENAVSEKKEEIPPKDTPQESLPTEKDKQ